jgi:hypothetical protein
MKAKFKKSKLFNAYEGESYKLSKVCIILHYVNVTQRDVFWHLCGSGPVSIGH